jgi:hypothetical protein
MLRLRIETCVARYAGKAVQRIVCQQADIKLQVRSVTHQALAQLLLFSYPRDLVSLVAVRSCKDNKHVFNGAPSAVVC